MIWNVCGWRKIDNVRLLAKKEQTVQMVVNSRVCSLRASTDWSNNLDGMKFKLKQSKLKTLNPIHFWRPNRNLVRLPKQFLLLYHIARILYLQIIYHNRKILKSNLTYWIECSYKSNMKWNRWYIETLMYRPLLQ